MAVAQPGTTLRPESSRTVGFAPFVNVGGSLTPVTVIVKVWVALVSSPLLAMPPLSWSSIVIVALPTPAAAGVNVSVPVGPTAGWTAKSALSVLFVTENATVWANSFAGPSLIAVAQPGIECAPEFSKTVWLPPLVKEGGSLTAVTVIVNVAGALSSVEPPPLSWAWSVIVATPLAFAAGV